MATPLKTESSEALHSMSYNRQPIEAVIDALDLDNSRRINCSGQICFVSNFAGVMEVAVHRDMKGNVYIRALDLSSPRIWKTDKDQDPAEDNDERITIKAWRNKFQDRCSGTTQPGLRVRQVYRTMKADPNAEISHQYSTTDSKFGRTTGIFVVIEMIPYLLFHIERLSQSHNPLHAPVWTLLKAINTLPGVPLSCVGVRKYQKVTLERIQAGETPSQIFAPVRVKNANRWSAKAVEEVSLPVVLPIVLETAPIPVPVEEPEVTIVPPLQGLISEARMASVFRDQASDHCFVRCVGRIPGHADIMLLYEHAFTGVLIGYAIVDIKDWLSVPVTGDHVTKLERDIDNCTAVYGDPPLWAGMVSLRSTICHDDHMGVHYRYKSIQVLLVDNLLTRGTEDEGLAVRQILALGEYHVLDKLERGIIPKNLRIDLLTVIKDDPVRMPKPTAEQPPAPRFKKKTVRRSKAVARPADQVTSEDSDTPEADSRLFKNKELLRGTARTRVLQLSQLICWKEGSRLKTTEISKVLAKFADMELRRAREAITETCIIPPAVQEFKNVTWTILGAQIFQAL